MVLLHKQMRFSAGDSLRWLRRGAQVERGRRRHRHLGRQRWLAPPDSSPSRLDLEVTHVATMAPCAFVQVDFGDSC
jgi:hypothetical protein